MANLIQKIGNVLGFSSNRVPSHKATLADKKPMQSQALPGNKSSKYLASQANFRRKKIEEDAFVVEQREKLANAEKAIQQASDEIKKSEDLVREIEGEFGEKLQENSADKSGSPSATENKDSKGRVKKKENELKKGMRNNLAILPEAPPSIQDFQAKLQNNQKRFGQRLEQKKSTNVCEDNINVLKARIKNQRAQQKLQEIRQGIAQYALNKHTSASGKSSGLAPRHDALSKPDHEKRNLNLNRSMHAKPAIPGSHQIQSGKIAGHKQTAVERELEEFDRNFANHIAKYFSLQKTIDSSDATSVENQAAKRKQSKLTKLDAIYQTAGERLIEKRDLVAALEITSKSGNKESTQAIQERLNQIDIDMKKLFPDGISSTLR
jgi:hypothetical protein